MASVSGYATGLCTVWSQAFAPLRPTTPSTGIIGGWVGIIGRFDGPHHPRGGAFDYFVYCTKGAVHVYGNSRSEDEVKHLLLQSDFACLVDSCTYV